MFWAKFGESSRKLVYSTIVVASAAAVLIVAIHRSSPIVNAAPTASFSGTGTGAIPDGIFGAVCHTTTGAPLNITFNVTGITGSVTDVSLSMTADHTFIGDLTVTLTAPNNASHVIFARTGASAGNGDNEASWGQSDDMNGTYNFGDANTNPPSGGWWQEARTTTDTAHLMTPGNYRTTASGGDGAPIYAPATSMNAAFSGVRNANGTWTLRITDGCNGDLGSVTAATLTIVGGGTIPSHPNVDMNADGKTDFVVTRGTNSPWGGPASQETAANFRPGSRVNRDIRRTPGTRLPGNSAGLTSDAVLPMYWYTALNGTFAVSLGQVGEAPIDFQTPEDFDGDGIDDLAVWTPGPPDVANFKILQSTTNTVRVELFGMDGDDPAVVGDYDGDGKADPATFRCPTDVEGQCYFFFRGSLNNPTHGITYRPWGFGLDGDFFPLVGDFDGDRKNDFCLQRSNPSSPINGQFVLLRSSDFTDEYINWGLSGDFIIPGDYDGDGKSDFCVMRLNDPVAGARTFYVLTRNGAVSQFRWGITGDLPVPGDYDGDGKTDIAIWRGSADPDQNYYWILRSSDLGVNVFEWGVCPDLGPDCDYPVANWAVH